MPLSPKLVDQAIRSLLSNKEAFKNENVLISEGQLGGYLAKSEAYKKLTALNLMAIMNFEDSNKGEALQILFTAAFLSGVRVGYRVASLEEAEAFDAN